MTRIEELMNLLNISKDEAELVLFDMECSALDFSECEQSEFDEQARESLIAVRNGTALFKSDFEEVYE